MILTPAEYDDATDEQRAAHDAAVKSRDLLTEKLGELTDRNTREATSNKLLLALCKGETPAPEDVQKLEDAITAYDHFRQVAAPYLEALTDEADIELPAPEVPAAE